MDIFYEAKNLLDAAGYNTALTAEKDWLIFEDEALCGFVCVAPNAEEIVATWEKCQDSFLVRNAPRLRLCPEKAWNAYSVFLTESVCPPALKSTLLKIEEDFRGTRKIVQTEISSSDELYASLFPLLPIKNLVSLVEVDSQSRIESRLSFLKSGEREALKQKEIDPTVAELLLRGE